MTEVHTLFGGYYINYTVVLSLVSWSGIASSLSNMIPDLQWFKQKTPTWWISWIKPTPSWWINSLNHHLVYVWGSGTFSGKIQLKPINPGDEFLHPNHDPIRQGARMKRRQATCFRWKLDLHGLRARHGGGRAGATRAGGKPGNHGKSWENQRKTWEIIRNSWENRWEIMGTSLNIVGKS